MVNLNNKEYCQALGLEIWELRNQSAQQQPDAPTQNGNAHELSLATLKQTVSQCVACSLSKTRTQTVFGVGNENADLMIIGEAPGFYEDKQGEPFVGRAGQLLTAMIEVLGFTRNQVYIANILKCRPQNNRDPQPEEVATCTPFLNQQIDFVKPRLILAVGRIAAHYLLKTKSSLESLRNKIYRYGKDDTALIVTYHPAYLLRNPADKQKAYTDLQFTQKTLQNMQNLAHNHASNA